MSNKIPRRDFLGLLVVGIGGALVTNGCGLPLFLRAGVPRLGGVMWGAVRTRTLLSPISRNISAKKAGNQALLTTVPRLTAKALIDSDDWYLPLEASASEMERLENEHPRLVLYDDRGDEFETPYGIFEDVGIIQSCYSGEPRYMFEQPDFDSRRITKLNVGNEVGVFDLQEGATTGWYQVQTTSRDKGWIHGNCLESLPASKYYS